MNRHELVAVAARRTSLTQRQMREALDALLKTIAQTLGEGEQVALADFWSLLSPTLSWPLLAALRWRGPVGILCPESLLAACGEPPVACVDAIAMTTQEIAAAQVDDAYIQGAFVDCKRIIRGQSLARVGVHLAPINRSHP